MRLQIAKALSRLLIFSHVFCGVQASPYLDPDSIVSTQNASTGDTANALLAKRTLPTLTMVPAENHLQSTWIGIVTEPPNSGWSMDIIDDYVYMGWKQTQDAGAGPTLVTALWVQGAGVYLGSIPHANHGSERIDVEIAFEILAEHNAPLMWHHASGRNRVGGSEGALWHSEDMAMVVYEREKKPTGRYPAHCYLVTYGQYHSRDRIGKKDPCREPSAGIDPSCTTVLRALSIEYA